MEPSVLIGIFAVIFLVTGRYIWKKDVLYGGIYFFLFIYTIFSQIGYAYFPELSVFLKAYFGPEVFYKVNFFVTLSFLSFFLFFFFLYRHVIKKPAYKIIQSQPRLTILFYMGVICHLLGLALYFFSHYDILDYSNASDEFFRSQYGLAYILFSHGFKLSVGINLLLYFLFRVRIKAAPKVNRRAVLILLVLEMIMFVVMAIKLGSRTDPLALSIAIVVLEIVIGREQGHTIRKNIWKWGTIALLFVVVLFGLNALNVTRNPDAPRVESEAAAILFKDYYAPAHILIAAMALDYVDPVEVIVSNSANALMLLKQPYLQATVMELFIPGVATRSASYAFYLFSEGYIAMGWFGFLYNGLVVFLGVTLWKLMANSNSKYYNIFMIGLVATQFVNIARGQSSYFVKDVYLFFIPLMFFFFLATGLRPWLGSGVWWRKSRINPDVTTYLNTGSHS